MKKKIEFIGGSTQISNEKREKLSKKMVNDALKKEEKKLAEMGDDLIEMAYLYFLKPYQKTLGLLPERWVSKVEKGTRISITARSGYREYVYGEVKHDYFRPCDSSSFPGLKADDKDHAKMLKEYEKIKKASSDISEKRKKLMAKTNGALSAIRTTKQLFDNWPEAYVVYCKVFAKNTAQFLPMIPVKELNTELGLKQLTK